MCGIVGFTGNPENKEQIIRAMENDKIPLAESLALYEEGVGIVRRLSAELDDAERKIKILQQNAQGEIVAVDFVTEEDV